MYLVAYDIDEGDDYEALWEAIQGCGDAERIQESVWLLSSQMSRDDILETVAQHIESDERVLVCVVRHLSAVNPMNEARELAEREDFDLEEPLV